jgi:ABC-type uncharacterized transport system ATPase subunit
VLCPCDLVLLDEPFSALDAGGLDLLDQLIRQLRDSGTTLVMSTHDIERGKSLCDRELRLDNGRAYQRSLDGAVA